MVMANYLQTIETHVNANHDDGLEERDTTSLNMRDKVTGGFPISAYDGTGASFTQGGGHGPIDGIAQIKHLYVPVGLVMFPRATLQCQNIHKNTEADILEDALFDKLFQSVTKNVEKQQKKKTKTKNNRKRGDLARKTRKQ
jgi:hypothetical protein